MTRIAVITALVVVSITAIAQTRDNNGRHKGQFIVPVLTGTSTPNCTPNVADLQSATVGAAIQGAASGATICLPAGTVTWTSYVEILPVVASNVTVMGQTTCTGAAATLSCTDNTIIIDNIDRSGGERSALKVFLPTTGTFRLSGITFKMAIPDNGVAGPSDDCSFVNYCTQSGTVSLAPDGAYTPLVRLDHLHFDHVRNLPWYSTNVAGVADRVFYDMTDVATDNALKAMGPDDDTRWNADTGFGDALPNTFMYIEDSRFVNGGAMNDCHTSGKQVFRYNYATNTGLQEHGTGHSGQNRGCRAMEAYGNSINGGATSSTTAFGYYTGPAIVFSNSTSGMGSFIQYTETRQSNVTYTQNATPTGWGYCGTQFNGTASVWDGNTNGATGYPCLDQVGRGKGDLLSGSFSTRANSTRGCTVNFTWAARASNCDTTDSSAWPRQALEPAYEFLNTGSVSGTWNSVFVNGALSPSIAVNRDFYSDQTSASCVSGGACTSGIGTGTSLPTTCTTNTGYWKTDAGGNWNTSNGTANDGALYQCTAPNTWTLYYTPYTYPHPLRGGS